MFALFLFCYMKFTRNRIITLSGISVAALVLFCNLFCDSPSKENKNENLTYLNHHDTVKYVGIQTCRACHNDIYNTFIETGMGQSFNVASHEKTAAQYGKHHVVYDKFSDLYYYPYWERDSMYIMEFRLQGKDTVHKRIEQVAYIIGSGQHTNSHLTNINGFVYQLPLTWYAQKKKWDLPPGFENGRNVRFNRAIGFECMSCHNAMPGFDDGSLNKFVSIPKGIDCERCHGPGELHVKEKTAGNLIDTANQVDYTIVNPKKLSWELQTDICQRCHLQGNAVLKEGKTFRDFRPGMKLGDYIDIYMPKYKGHEDEFIMASHAQRLQMSKCFINSSTASPQHANKLTCITCHNPHISVKVTGKQVFNNACGNCHNMQSSCTEKMALRTAENDNCVGCHMPRSGTIDIPHVTVTDHWIRKPATPEAKKALKEFAGIYCINNKQSDVFTKGRAYLSYFETFEGEASSLDSAAKYIAMVPSSPETIDAKAHLLYLKQDYAGLVKMAAGIDPNNKKPWLCYRIGQAYQNLGDAVSAITWYERANKLAPENLDFLNKLGAALIEADRTQEGVDVLNNSLGKNPKQGVALTNIGFAYLKLNDLQRAEMYYNKALALDPDMEQALFNKAALLHMTGRTPQAKKLLQQIIKRNPGNQMVKELLQQI